MSDRKYRQRGYQDDDRARGRAGDRRPAPPREPREGPRGRGLGAPTQTVFKCAACGARQELQGEVAVEAACPRCGGDLHACSNCRYFDTSARNECSKGGALPPGATAPVRIAKKTQRNDCTLFAPKAVQDFAQESPESGKPDDPRAAFDALFKF
jgi:hypothetical protein